MNAAKRLRKVKEEIRRLKRLVAEKAVHIQVHNELLGKRVVPAAQR